MSSPLGNPRNQSTISASSTTQRPPSPAQRKKEVQKHHTWWQRNILKRRDQLYRYYKANEGTFWQIGFSVLFLIVAYLFLSFMFVWNDKSVKFRDRQVVWADNFLTRFMPKSYTNKVCEFVEGNVKGDVLEVGAGQGFTLNCLNPNNIKSYSSVDPNTYSVIELRKRVGKYLTSKGVRQDKILTQSAEDLSASFKDDSFDTVLMTHVMCSVEDDKLEKVLAEVYRVLKPGGKLVFVEHVRGWQNSWTQLVQKWAQPWWKWLLGGCQFHDAKTYVNLLELQSFEVKWWMESCPMVKYKLDLGILDPHLYGIAHKSLQA
eukprot:CAMPEP_0117438186 /NCGR_PEP_ID=MMETSP0759-20121206/1923_1 /TAXON_ID=63605 /ORGANISM="Percolomonas cosmopolitus, Strain WS" /LENGTH=316 /DNA_ID=CAMNT_0005229869 /DNA_START=421 /DNA_END=1371 /DNA_ORIENTATION=-